MSRPDPFREIRVIGLHTVPGANFWSRHPVTRMDLHPGRYDEISSAEVPGFSDRLVEALPGLATHGCSIGEPGGFLIRLERGTYAPHIIEHVALEMQAEVGHDVRYGRTRGGDRPGEYTIVVGHRHPGVGRAALEAALEAVRRGFAGAPIAPNELRRPLEEAARKPSPSPAYRHDVDLVMVGSPDAISRQRGMAEVRGEEAALIAFPELLERGVLVREADAGVVLDLDPSGLPPRYRERDRIEKLASLIGDALRPAAVVAVPSAARGLATTLGERGHRTVTERFEAEPPAMRPGWQNLPTHSAVRGTDR